MCVGRDLEEAVRSAGMADLRDNVRPIGNPHIDDGDVGVAVDFSEKRSLILRPDVVLREAMVVRSGGEKLVGHGWEAQI